MRIRKQDQELRRALRSADALRFGAHSGCESAAMERRFPKTRSKCARTANIPDSKRKR